jgi:hypothetical protein
MKNMKIIGKIVTGVLIRAFTKKNGSVIATTSETGVWDLEATLAWFLRAVLVMLLLYLAKELDVDPQLVIGNMP